VGLDRAPEVKTIRRKLGELAAAGRAEQLQMAIARHHAAARPDQLGFFYIDGHAKGGYFGTRDVQKMHVARLKFPAPGTEETWVTDGAGDPLLVVMAQPSSSLASQIRGLLPQPRGIAGQDRKVTLCFDRGGWSPDLFADIIDAGFHLLTYRKNDTGKDAPALPAKPSPRPAGPETTAASTSTTSPTPQWSWPSARAGTRAACWSCGRSLAASLTAATPAARCTS
jgi:hypothetical protein